MLFKEIYIKSKEKEVVNKMVDFYESMITLRTEARLGGLEPPLTELSQLMHDYMLKQGLKTKFDKGAF